MVYQPALRAVASLRDYEQGDYEQVVMPVDGMLTDNLNKPFGPAITNLKGFLKLQQVCWCQRCQFATRLS